MNNLDKNIIDITEKDWIGIVVDNNDPEKEHRCRVKVFGLFDDLENECIPWAYPRGNCQFAGGDGGFGMSSVPKLNSIVKIKFDNGNIYAPEYYGIQHINETIKEEIGDDYLNSHILFFDEDEELMSYYTSGKGLYTKLKDTEIQIDNDNNVSIKTPKSSIKLNSGGSAEINADNRITINTDKLGGSGAFRNLIRALSADLTIAQSGSNLTNWMVENYTL